MKKQILTTLALSLSLILTLNCCKKDDENTSNEFPIKLVMTGIENQSDALLRTIDGDTSAPSLGITQELSDFMNDVDKWAPKEINLVNDSLSQFTASEFGEFYQQFELDSIPYQVVGQSYTFVKTDNNRITEAMGNNEKLSIPYQALLKRGTTNGGKIHIPTSFETFLINDFFSGDSLVYITYDVVYEVE